MKDGEPAFPGTFIDVDSMGNRVVRESYQGMMLRDYFAAKALPVVITGIHEKVEGKTRAQVAAEWAYAYADAMLIERDK